MARKVTSGNVVATVASAGDLKTLVDDIDSYLGNDDVVLEHLEITHASQDNVEYRASFEVSKRGVSENQIPRGMSDVATSVANFTGVAENPSELQSRSSFPGRGR